MGKKIVIGLKYLLLGIWTIICLFPIYWLVCFSLKDNAEIFGENIAGLPRSWIFSNYQSAFMGGNVGIYLLNSVIVTGMTILLTIIVAVTASYALERMVWKLRKIAMTIFMIGIMIPIHAALLPVFYMMQTLHILNTTWSLIIPYVAFAMPVAIMIMAGFVAGIPRELEESASIDGASIYKIFLTVILPLLKPAIATVSIFTFIQAWNELMFATVFISNNAKKTLTVGIQSMSGQFLTQWGPIGAALVVATIPTIVIYLLLNRQVQDSLVMGAVKG